MGDEAEDKGEGRCELDDLLLADEDVVVACCNTAAPDAVNKGIGGAVLVLITSAARSVVSLLLCDLDDLRLLASLRRGVLPSLKFVSSTGSPGSVLGCCVWCAAADTN